MGIVWDKEATAKLIYEGGYEFARVATPKGWRTKGKERLLFSGKKILEGNCFAVSLQLAYMHPDMYWYCEGYALGTPHAWLALKNFEEGWCIDLTWRFFSLRDGCKILHDDYPYYGVCFEGREAADFLTNRQREGKDTSTSMLK